jgi:hypothetical protein
MLFVIIVPCFKQSGYFYKLGFLIYFWFGIVVYRCDQFGTCMVRQEQVVFDSGSRFKKKKCRNFFTIAKRERAKKNADLLLSKLKML